jgi:hypothetical protein
MARWLRGKPDARDCRGTRDASLGVWCRGWRFFPLARGAARASPTGGKARGSLIRSLTEGRGMPLAHRTTPANGDERAQVLPWLDAVQVRTGKRGRPRKRLKVIATDKGMMPKRCGSNSGSEGAGRRSRSASGRRSKTGDDRSKKSCRGSRPSAPLLGSSRNIVAWWSGGSILPPASKHFLRSPRSISGSTG